MAQRRRRSAASHGLAVRCIWLDTPLAHAQVNLVERLLDRFGRLLAPPELKAAARQEPGVLTPTQQMRVAARARAAGRRRGLRKHRAAAVRAGGTGGTSPACSWRRRSGAAAARSLDGTAPHSSSTGAPTVDCRPRGLAAPISASVETAVCAHPGGPPTCWCRPPLPGLVLEFARRHVASIPRARSWWARAPHTERSRPPSTRQYVDASG